MNSGPSPSNSRTPLARRVVDLVSGNVIEEAEGILAFEPAARARGREVALPSIEALRDGDPMTDRVVEQIALGVSTRGYERSLEPVDDSIETRGASKSNASRALIDATTEKLA